MSSVPLWDFLGSTEDTRLDAHRVIKVSQPYSDMGTRQKWAFRIRRNIQNFTRGRLPSENYDAPKSDQTVVLGFILSTIQIIWPEGLGTAVLRVRPHE